MKSVGIVNSTERPQDRSDVARFYAASSPTLVFNMALRQVAEAEHRSLSDNARALALLNMATNDSLVASFSTKYHYNFWRPENAIRFLGDYGNPKTPPNPAYVPFITTPCFSSYPSNHASGSKRRSRDPTSGVRRGWPHDQGDQSLQSCGREYGIRLLDVQRNL